MAMEIDNVAECCPICCTEYQASGEHARITCSGRCRAFSMCRLCVHRQATYLQHPFVVDDDTGDFTTLDPTKCPQCNESGAFRDSELPPLSDEIMATEEEEAQSRRDGVAAAALERALTRLNDKPIVKFDNYYARFRNMEERDTIYKRINGSDQVFQSDADTLSFRFMSSCVGVPSLFCRSSVLYFEVQAETLYEFDSSARIGFALADGMEDDVIDVGCDYKSWGLDLFNRGIKSSHGDESYGSYVKPEWRPHDIIGVAVNVDKGMIAVSTNGNWELTEHNGVKFEDEKMKAGVYPLASGNNCTLYWRFDGLSYGPPPDSVWGMWPKFEDVHWINLPVEARAAAIRLGYTQTSWSGKGDNPIEDKKWDELSSEEKSAANVMGYNKPIWTHIMSAKNGDGDSDDDSDDGDSDDGSDSVIDNFCEMRWESLPEDAKRAAEVLHFTQTMWNEGEANPLMEEEWEDLTEEQKRSAILLGYDENSWGDSLDNGSPCDCNNSTDLPFEHMSWAELPRVAKEAARKLGLTEQLWNDHEPGPLELTRYDNLTEEQQFACHALGYVKTTWDFNVNKRLFNRMDMTNAFEAMMAMSVIMSNFN